MDPLEWEELRTEEEGRYLDWCRSSHLDPEDTQTMRLWIEYNEEDR